jgi:transcriptional regulator with XRE-family HTH domain
MSKVESGAASPRIYLMEQIIAALGVPAEHYFSSEKAFNESPYSGDIVRAIAELNPKQQKYAIAVVSRSLGIDVPGEFYSAPLDSNSSFLIYKAWRAGVSVQEVVLRLGVSRKIILEYFELLNYKFGQRCGACGGVREHRADCRIRYRARMAS